MIVFFFSSRRRHTRFDCDWSSDVCSSDLEIPLRRMRPANAVRGAAAPGGRHVGGGVPLPGLRPRGRVAHEPYGDSARRVPGREDRRGDDRLAARRKGGGGGDAREGGGEAAGWGRV